MKRRDFVKTAAILGSIPVLFNFCKQHDKTGSESNKVLIEKVKKAMLTMQRASWEQGLAVQSCLEINDIETTTLLVNECVLRQHKDGRLGVLYTDNGVTDAASCGEALWYLANKTGNKIYRESGQKMLEFLLNKAPKSKNGILYHTMDSPEIWIDSMYMAPPFLAVMGEFDEAIKQIEGFKTALWNNNEKLFSHRWQNEKQEFINEKFWGVGNGWALAGIARVINLLPENYNNEKIKLIQGLELHLNKCLEYKRTDGLFHDILNDNNSFVETNMSQMVAYTIYTGVKSGWLKSLYIKQAEHMREAAISKIDEYGYVQGVCGAPWFNSPGVAAEGQAFFILMEAARNKYLKQ